MNSAIGRIQRRTRAPRMLAGFVVLLTASGAAALELDGFTQPYRTINVAADDTGIIADVLVREGEAVDAGQPLVRLNNDVHLALLAIAKQGMEAEGQLDAAKAEFQLRKERLAKLESLRPDGHARQEEVDRARAELAVADANVRSAREDLLIKGLEYQQIKTRLDRRTVRSPISGAVTTLHKEQGEFVAPNNPEVLTLVELDRLLAGFSIMSPQAESLGLGSKVTVAFAAGSRKAEGVVEFISPIIDAESGTVQVKVRIENSDRRFRSGERCTLLLPK